jgi:hypothetical protein
MTFLLDLDRWCEECGQCLLVLSAKKLLSGKDRAAIISKCVCTSGLLRLTKNERITFLPRHRN